MGWYESRVYKSAWPQIEATAGVILNDPYLMPPSPIFWPVFDYLAKGKKENAEDIVTQILEDIIWHLHHGVKQMGTKDFEVDLLAFWNTLVEAGEKNNFQYFE